jgi:branched-chain amino acid transport system permease protein
MRNGVKGSSVVVLLTIVLLLLVPLDGNLYVMQVGNLLIIYIILTVGLNILMGYAGQFALANAAIFGIGAYVTGLLRVDLGLPFYLSAPAGVMAATLIGVCLAFPALRLSGVYLAFATTAFAWIASWTFMHWESVTRGAGGVSLPPLAFNAGFNDDLGVYYLSLLVLLVVLIMSRRLISSRFGRGLVALREGEIAAQSLGINILAYKSLAFAASSFFAGVAGALYTATLNFVSPDTFTLFHMVLQMAMVVVGGMGSFAGPIVGAFLLLIAQELMRDLQGLHEVFFGAVLLGFVAFLPQGLVPLIEQKLRAFRQPLSGAR